MLKKFLKNTLNRLTNYDTEEEIEPLQIPASTVSVVEPVNYYLDRINSVEFEEAIRYAIYNYNSERISVICKMKFDGQPKPTEPAKIIYGISVVAYFKDNSTTTPLDIDLFSEFDDCMVTEQQILHRENNIILLEGFAKSLINKIGLDHMNAIKNIGLTMEYDRIQGLIPEEFLTPQIEE